MATYTPQQFGGFSLPGGYQGNFLNIAQDPLGFVQRNVARATGAVSSPVPFLERNIPRANQTIIETNPVAGAVNTALRGEVTSQQETMPGMGKARTVVAPAVPDNSQILGEFDQALQKLLAGSGVASSGGGVSGGGYAGANASLASGATDMLGQIEANRNNQISQVQADYEAAIRLLGDTEASTQKGYGASKEYITSSEAANKANIAANVMRNKDQLRQGYQDATVLARQRARAVGGAASSGYLDTLQGLDKTLLQQLGGQDQAAQSNITQAALQAQKAMGDLESQLQKTIDAINAQKSMSLREKDKAIAQANIDASNNALEVKKWLMGQQASASARSGGGSSNIAANAKAALNGAQTNYVVALQLANELPEAQRGEAIARVDSLFRPKVASAGGNPSTMEGWKTSVMGKPETFTSGDYALDKERRVASLGINPYTNVPFANEQEKNDFLAELNTWGQ